MRVRKAEREAMVTMLEAEHEDVEALATDVLNVAWSTMMDREWWCVLHRQPGVWMSTHGPFESKAQADKYMATQLVGAGPDPSHAISVSMIKGGMTDVEEGLFDV